MLQDQVRAGKYRSGAVLWWHFICVLLPYLDCKLCLSVFKKQYKFKDFETLKSKRLEVTSQLNGNAVQRL